jgi:hypothetical protein
MVPTQNSSASADFAFPDPSPLSLPVHLVLEVTKGFTRFPRRPVTHPRFLIGAGSTCDLRLGGEGMPALHSLITISGREIALEAIAAEPALKVNGQRVQTALLHDGDVIDVGEVELLARFEAGQTPAGAQMTSAAPAAAIDDERPASELTAAELVELIEQDEKQIAEFEERQREGAQALVQAIVGRIHRSAARPGEIGVRAPIPAPHFLSKRPQILAAQTRQPPIAADRDPAVQQDIEALGRHLSELAHEIKGTTQRAAERETTYAEAADTLLDTQDRLVSQIEVLLDEVQTLKSSETPASKPRAIA